jgi:hypothetical protein
VAGLSFLVQFLFGDGIAIAVAAASLLLVSSLWYLLPWVRGRHDRKWHQPAPPRGRRAHEPFAEAVAHR